MRQKSDADLRSEVLQRQLPQIAAVTLNSRSEQFGPLRTRAYRVRASTFRTCFEWRDPGVAEYELTEEWRLRSTKGVLYQYTVVAAADATAVALAVMQMLQLVTQVLSVENPFLLFF